MKEKKIDWKNKKNESFKTSWQRKVILFKIIIKQDPGKKTDRTLKTGVKR